SADPGGDAGVLLAHVGARAKPLRHGLFEPLRVADLLVEVEVGAGGAAVHDQVAVLVALRLDNLGVDVGRLGHAIRPPSRRACNSALKSLMLGSASRSATAGAEPVISCSPDGIDGVPDRSL